MKKIFSYYYNILSSLSAKCNALVRYIVSSVALVLAIILSIFGGAVVSGILFVLTVVFVITLWLKKYLKE